MLGMDFFPAECYGGVEQRRSRPTISGAVQNGQPFLLPDAANSGTAEHRLRVESVRKKFLMLDFPAVLRFVVPIFFWRL